LSRGATISEELLPPRLPVIGVIKIGRLGGTKTSRGGSEFQLPQKLDHFLIGKTTRADDNNYVRDDEIHAALPEKPTSLDVTLPFDLRSEIFHAEMTHYEGRTTKTHECDGVTCTDPRKGTTRPCDRRAGRECPCKPYARLSVSLDASPTRGGVHVYRTRSWEAVSAMQTFLGQLEQAFGSLRGLPCRLELQESEVRYKDKGEQKVGTAYRVTLVLRKPLEETRAELLQYHRENRIARREIQMLAAGVQDELAATDAREAALLAQEFPDDDPPPPAGGRPEVGGPGAPTSKVGQANEEMVDELISELRGLCARAEASKVRITTTQAGSLERHIQARDAAKLSQAIDWLKGMLPADQPSLLES
jgi:hypothetical protein